MTLFWILGALFLALIIIIPIIERFGPKVSNENTNKMARYILPLVAILLILQLLSHVFKG